jgi:thioredoxin-like negative regulator of GroEL
LKEKYLMNSLVMIALCSAALGSDTGETYADAHQTAMKTGKPMLVMVSTEWCPACQVMKRRILPQLRQHPLFGRVAFASVNPDNDRELSNQLIGGGGPIPQLVLYRKTPRGWVRTVMIGSQSVENVEQFINQGIAADSDADSKPADANDKSKDTAAKPDAGEKQQPKA